MSGGIIGQFSMARRTVKIPKKQSGIMPILDKKRKKALDKFVKDTLSALKSLSKRSRTDAEKSLFERMGVEINSTPLLIYDRAALSAGIDSATFGEHVVQYHFMRNKGGTGVLASHAGGFPSTLSAERVVAEKFIRLPAWHVFSGDKVSKKGAFTLWHEWGHFQKPDFDVFLASHGIPMHMAEETAADILATVLAREFGYSEREVMARSVGRMPFSMIAFLVDRLMRK